MNTVTFKNIPNAMDKNKGIYVGDSLVGEVSRGWLRSGGEQWVVDLPEVSAFGDKTLKSLKRQILRKTGNA